MPKNFYSFILSFHPVFPLKQVYSCMAMMDSLARMKIYPLPFSSDSTLELSKARLKSLQNKFDVSSGFIVVIGLLFCFRYFRVRERVSGWDSPAILMSLRKKKRTCELWECLIEDWKNKETTTDSIWSHKETIIRNFLISRDRFLLILVVLIPI